MTDRMNLTIDIRPQSIGPKKVNIRSSLVVANLLAEIQDKFNLDGNLAVHLEGNGEPLGLGQPLSEAGVEDEATLICTRVQEETGTQEIIARGVREPLGEKFKRVYLEEKRSLLEFELGWQPAVIGRKDYRDPAKNRLLAADLEPVEDLPTVSRHHACITVQEGKFFLEQIQARNPTYLDGKRLVEGRKYPLSAGSEIQVGRVTLTFHVIS